MIAAAVSTPSIDWIAALPLLVLLGGSVVVLLAGLGASPWFREGLAPLLAAVSFGVAGALGALGWGDAVELFVAKGAQGALVFDDLAVAVMVLVCAAGLATVILSLRSRAPEQAEHGEYYALLLAAAGGMVILAAAQNLVTIFVGLELLSIPLYVLCAAEMRRARSLEAGLKYLIIGSLGSATFLYGLALLYGASGDTDLRGVAEAVTKHPSDSLVLAGIALTIVGLAFKASVAPFHQWTPDVYEGAPTPVTAFMAVATKAATLIAFLRIFDVALLDAHDTWAPILATLAAVTIVVGNAGALGQDSLKRLLAWSSVAQAGYLLAGVVVATTFGAQATLFYLAGYAAMTLAAFAVVIARERESEHGDSIDSLAGIGSSRPLLAWPMTIAMLGLAGIPATVGFIGKFALIGAVADGGYAWLGIVIVLGSAVSLAYYLRVVAVIWRTGGEGSGVRAPGGWEVTALALAAAAATVVAGVVPNELMDVARDAARALGL
ncbi:MAG: NADH-quinone oxidoreductase subunit N [Baekduia sp.]